MDRKGYASRLKRMNVALYILLAVSVVYMVLVGEAWRFGIELLDSRTLTRTASNMQRLIFFGWQVYMIWRIVHNRKLLSDAARMDEERIEVSDERIALINGMAGKTFAFTLMILLSVATLVASSFDLTAFYTLYYVLLGALALWFGLGRYYRWKM